MDSHGGKGLLSFGQLRSRAMDSHGGKAPIPHDLENRAIKRALGFARDMRRAKGSSLYHRVRKTGQGPLLTMGAQGQPPLLTMATKDAGEKEPGMMEK